VQGLQEQLRSGAQGGGGGAGKDSHASTKIQVKGGSQGWAAVCMYARTHTHI